MKRAWERYGVLALSLLTLSALFTMRYWQGEGSYIRIHDNLDGMLPTYRALTNQGAMFAGLDGRVEQIFNGIPRSSLPSEMNIGVLIYHFFGTFWGLLVNDAIMCTLGLLGMVLLLRDHVMPQGPDYVVYGAALCFALLPHLPVGFLSIAGQPLLFWSMLNLRRRRMRWVDWLVIALFPFYSSLVLVGFVVLTIFAGLLAFDLATSRRLNPSLLIALSLLACLYLASEYRLIHQTFFQHDYVSHRVEFRADRLTLQEVSDAVVRNLHFGRVNQHSNQSPVILWAIAVAGAIFAIRAISRRIGFPKALMALARERDIHVPHAIRSLLGAIAMIVALSIWAGLWRWDVVQEAVHATGSDLLKAFNFKRFDMLQPMLWAVAFGFSLAYIDRSRLLGRVLACGLIVANVFLLGTGIFGPLPTPRSVGLTYEKFFSEPLFREIQASIGRDPSEYRVVSLGLLPAIPLYNGFYVLDGYFSNYPLSHKHQFRRVVAPELEKRLGLMRSFDDWGGRCYLLCAELPDATGVRRFFTKDGPLREVENLQINTEALRELGGDYILSAVEILSHERLGLSPMGVFRRKDSPWEIFLYAVGD